MAELCTPNCPAYQTVLQRPLLPKVITFLKARFKASLTLPGALWQSLESVFVALISWTLPEAIRRYHPMALIEAAQKKVEGIANEHAIDQMCHCCLH